MPRWLPLARRNQPAVGTGDQLLTRTRKTFVSCVKLTLLLLAVLTFLVATAVAKLTPAAVSVASWYRTFPDCQVAPAIVRLTDVLIGGSVEPFHVTVNGGREGGGEGGGDGGGG